MPSPFPGIDPYLERHWPGVRVSLTTYARDQIAPWLPDDLAARVHAEDHVFDSEFCMGNLLHLELRDQSNCDQLVTVVKFLSPHDRTPNYGWEFYATFQRRWLKSGVNPVELQLFRDGFFTLAVPGCFWRTPLGQKSSDAHKRFLVNIRRVTNPARLDVIEPPLRERLPRIQIPLRPTDADVVLDLQPLIDQCYDAGRYQRIDYLSEPEPPLDEADAEWADELLRRAGRRT